MSDFIAVLTLGLQATDRTIDAFEAEINRVGVETDISAEDLENRVGELEETLLHNLITKALDDPKVKIVPDADIIRILGEETAAWVFDGSQGSIFGKFNETNNASNASSLFDSFSLNTHSETSLKSR